VLVAYASNRAGGGHLDLWVQQTAGGGAVQLTRDATDDRSPDISPDGTRIAFRSDRAGGGVYVMPALGGDARLIAPRGRTPKFSPDGRSIAFWVGGWLAPRGVLSVRRSYIIDANGGAPVQMPRIWRAAAIPSGDRTASRCSSMDVGQHRLKAEIRIGGSCPSLEAHRGGPTVRRHEA
jgi:dipeptidyl aminopeptidase/acylaminoacyl peptidase